jgi:ABC-2 type transport system ATP-binding protein
MLAAFDGGDARQRIGEVLDTVELIGREHDKVGGYSHGMRQRLGIAGALLREPRLLLLDEPATGLDPGGMRDMRILVRRLADEGMTVLLSSHLMNEVEELCNRVAIVRSGAIVYEGEIAELKRTAGGSYRLRTTDNDRALELCADWPGVKDARRDGDAIRFAASEEAVAELSRALVEADALILALTPETATLEDLFFSLTEGPQPERVAVPA